MGKIYKSNDEIWNEVSLSSVTKIVLVLMLVLGAPKLFTQFGSSIMYGNVGIGMLGFIIGLVNAVALILILFKKGVGVWMFFGMIALEIVISIVFVGLPEGGSVIIVGILRAAVMYGLLSIRRKGFSGWDVLFDKQGVIDIIRFEEKKAAEQEEVTPENKS